MLESEEFCQPIEMPWTMIRRIAIWVNRSRQKSALSLRSISVAKTKKTEEYQSIESGNDDSNKIKRPLAYSLISIWGYFESILFIIVLLAKEYQQSSNKSVNKSFMDGYCYKKDNSDAIICKILTSALLFIGGKTVSPTK